MSRQSRRKPLVLLTFAMAVASCGGGETDNVTQSIKEAINGPGGTWFGAFVEQEKTANTDDIDVGGIYLDIPTDITGTVTGAMSYQVYDCQTLNDLKIDGQKTRNRLQIMKASGDVDPRASADNALDSISKAVLIELTGGYNDNVAKPRPWKGSYDVLSSGSDDKTRISSECNGRTYTFADNGQWRAYSEDTQFGITATYDKTSNTLSWDSLNDVSHTLIMQLDTSRISSGDSAFVKQIVQQSDLTTFNPVVRDQPSTLVVQVFSDSGLVGFDAIRITP